MRIGLNEVVGSWTTDLGIRVGRIEVCCMWVIWLFILFVQVFWTNRIQSPITHIQHTSTQRAAANNLSARRRCHCCCLLILLQFSMTKKVIRKFWRLNEILFGDLRKEMFLAVHATPPNFLDRRLTAVADRIWPSRSRRHNDVGARLYPNFALVFLCFVWIYYSAKMKHFADVIDCQQMQSKVADKINVQSKATKFVYTNSEQNVSGLFHS